jgi:hypothetical protein
MFAGVTMHTSIQEIIKDRIKRSKKTVFFRRDFEGVGTYRHVSRVLSELENQQLIVRAGYGVYTKPVALERREQVLGEIKTKLGRRVNRLVEVGGITYRLGRRQPTKPNAHTELDKLKLARALEILRTVEMKKIREKSLENLRRWKEKGTWCSAYDEWTNLMRNGTDAEVSAVMSGTDENSNRLRQSSPYAGLLDQQTRERIRETTRT